MYYYGCGVEKDYDEAKEWLEIAAKKGHEDAKKKLAELNAEITSKDNQ